MSIQCVRCPYIVAVLPGERPPVWCPRCGADLKVSTQELVGKVGSAAPAMPVSTSCIGREASAALPALADPVIWEPASLPARVAPSLLADGPTSVEPEEVFRTSLLWQAIAWGCLLVCLGIVAIAASQAIQPQNGKPVQIGVYGCMGLFGIGALVSAFVAIRFTAQKYEVFADRLVEWQFFKSNTYRWDHIREVYQSIHPAWTSYRIVTRRGEFKICGEIKNYKRLGESIAQHVVVLLLPAALRKLESDRKVHFGPFSVTKAGVMVTGQLEPWHRLGVLSLGLNPNPQRGTSIVSNMVHLRLGSSWIELGDIPNYRLFEELARHLFTACVSPDR